MPSCEFIKPGIYTSLQDQGRYGMAYYAIPPSGFMDHQSAKNANRLVGNPIDSPVLECSLSGPTVKFHNSAIIAITGSSMKWKINGNSIDMDVALNVNEGDILTGTYAAKQLYAYISIQGSIKTKFSYSSCSVYPPAKLGHLEGRTFQAGDILEWTMTADQDIQPIQARQFSTQIPIIPGPEYNYLTELAKQLLRTSYWSKSVDSNRMGARLNGPKLATSNRLEDSVPILPGYIQLPPSGFPIVVLQDGQTTGGYPRIAFIERNALDDFNQIGLKKELQFNLIDEEWIV